MMCDTQAQCDMFDDYAAETAEFYSRTQHGTGYSYKEIEWEAFQAGWNAALKHLTKDDLPG